MKIIILLICCISFPLCALCQYKNPSGFIALNNYRTIDSAYMKVTYRLMSVRDPSDPVKSAFEDIQTLQMGAKISKFFSQNLVLHSEKVMKDIKRGVRAVEANPYRGSYAYEIFQNHPYFGEITVTDLGDFDNVNYMYEESTPVLAWIVLPKTKKILNYACMKATTSFRGRNYTAWFTTEIPINSGPWKFCGLPGLIMQISDDKNHYNWECIGIEKLKTKEPLRFYEIKFAKISRADLDKLQRRKYKDEIAFWNTSDIKVRTRDKVTGAYVMLTNSSAELPYNPIELE